MSRRDHPSPQLPEKIGPYRLMEEIGSGGMGHVFRAQREPDGLEVALKILAAPLVTDRRSVERFQREIDVLQRLDHPHIVRLLDAGRHDGLPYFVMEYVEGTSLTNLIQRLGRVPWRQAVQWGIQICEALEHAHSRGIIHRDLKPGNVLVSLAGQVKLTDFGIARLVGSVTLTAAGNVVGTAEYMSPEQAAGKRVTPRSDLYGLGALLYTMVTGRPPFRGKDYLEVIQKHRFSRFDPPRELVPGLPIWLDDLICELLEKDPDRRPDSAAVVRRRLAAILKKQALRDEERQHLVEPAEDPAEDAPTAVLVHEAPKPLGPTKILQLLKARRADDERPIERTRRWINRALLLLAAAVVGWWGWGYWQQRNDPRQQWERLEAKIRDLREGDLAAVVPQLRDFVHRFPATPEAAEAERYLRDLELRLRRHQLLRSTLVRSLRPTGYPLSRYEERYLRTLLIRWLDSRETAIAELEALLGDLAAAEESVPGTLLQMVAEDYVALVREEVASLVEAGDVEEASRLVRRAKETVARVPKAPLRRRLEKRLTALNE